MNFLNNLKSVFVASFILIVTTLGNSASAQTTNYQAYSLFTYNFMKYTSWAVKEGNLVITVVGKSKVFNELTTLTASKNIEGKKIEILQANSFEDLKHSQIVFVADGKSGELKQIVEKTKGRETLVITEREGLVSKGACISFVVLENGALRFQVNDQELNSRNIKLANVIMALAQQN